MKYRNLLLGGIVIFALTAAYTVWMFGHLPDRVPMHWNIQGRVDSYADRWTGSVFSPAMQLGLLILFLVLPVISPRKAKIDEFAGAYETICLYVLAFIGYVHVLALQSAVGPVDVSRAVICGVFVLLALIGNLLTKSRRNYWMGIRTPWTLESEEVWNRTHRFGGRLIVACSMFCLVAVLVGAPVAPMFVILMAALFVPVVYSYFIYRKTSRA